MFKGRITRAATAVLMAVTLGACAAPQVQDRIASDPQPHLRAEMKAMQVGLEVGPLSYLPPQVLAQVPPSGKAILVNIPSFELIALEDRQPVMRSRVIVGKRATPTPVWNTETSVVRFRPTWTPTPSMIASGRYTPGTRPAGPRNPLGHLAIRLEPGTLIYLHGTNKPKLYEREMRALSHGCVRVERWDEVAAWVLGLTVDEVHGHAYGRRTFDVETSGVPVIITYQTEFPDANGVMQSWPDIYNRGSYAGVRPVQGTL